MREPRTWTLIRSTRGTGGSWRVLPSNEVRSEWEETVYVQEVIETSEETGPTEDKELRQAAQAFLYAYEDVLAGETDGKGSEHVEPHEERLRAALNQQGGADD